MDPPNRDSAPAGLVTVVGIGADGWAGLTGAARDALRAAAVIAGSPRQLALLPDLGARRVPLPSPLLEHLDDLVRDNPGLCLLASGDPTLHGIGATLARRLGADRLRILPAVSSVALACGAPLRHRLPSFLAPQSRRRRAPPARHCSWKASRTGSGPAASW